MAVAALVLTSCGGPRLVHDTELLFGDVPVGESRAVALVLSNEGSSPGVANFSVDEAEFAVVGENSRWLNPGETATVLVRFTPTDLGRRSGTLSIGGALVALSGRGTGPRLSAPDPVILAPFALVTGQPPVAQSSTIILRNTGTAGSLLQLAAPRVDGAELCVGTFVGSVCEAWQPPATLDTEMFLEVPLSLRPTSAGARQWAVTFPSNDPIRPESTLEVRALVDSYEPCVFEAPPELELSAGPAVLTVRNIGPGTCLIRQLSAFSTPMGLLNITEPTAFPLRLENNVPLRVTIGFQPGAPAEFDGRIRIEAAGTAPLEVLVKRRAPLTSCLVTNPSVLDFGTERQSCNSPILNFQLYNPCARPVVVDSVSIGAAAGEAPGGPNCAGTAACPEFFIVSGVPAGIVIPSGGTPANIAVKYRPINVGADTGTVVISVRDFGDVIVVLQGRGDTGTRTTDTFRQYTPSKVDLLVMVDTSPSFLPRRAATRTNLLPLLNRLSSPCINARVAFAPADGAPDSGVRLQQNDAGSTWTTSGPLFVDRALSAFDALPIGSEVEACIGPAADLMEDAGVRANSYFSGLCVTDALEQSANPTAALQRLQARGNAAWNAVAGFGATCGVESIDDGVHASLVTASNGSSEEICAADWGPRLVGTSNPTCGYRTSFFLSSRPSSTAVPEVRVDGVVVPQADWTYDTVSNAIEFVRNRVPGPGSTVEVSYDMSCDP